MAGQERRQIRGHKVVSGARATLTWDGEPIYEAQAFDARVTLNRTDIQMDMSVDSKLVGAAGAVNMRIYHVYTRVAKKALEALKEGRDIRYNVISNIGDPDAVDGQNEMVAINNVWLNEFPLHSWERGNAESQEFSGGFTPTDTQITAAIEAGY